MICLKVVELIGKRPFGRYMDKYGNRSGEYFRNTYLYPHLLYGNRVHVDLDGYNQYGRSFIMGAFTDLILVDELDYKFLSKRLTYHHSKLNSINQLIDYHLLKASIL